MINWDNFENLIKEKENRELDSIIFDIRWDILQLLFIAIDELYFLETTFQEELKDG